MNLTLRRAIQVREAIRQREEVRAWENLKALEWVTKNVSMLIANTVETKEARDILSKVVDGMSITGAPPEDSKNLNRNSRRSKKSSPETYKTKDGKTIPASELSNYSYDEIDHTDEDAEALESARNMNRGKNLTDMFNPR